MKHVIMRWMKIISLFMMMIIIGGCSFTSARFSDLQMAKGADEDYQPIDATTTFATDTPAIYIVGAFNNAPEGTVILVEWYYLETSPATFIDDTEYTLDSMSGRFSFNLSKPTAGWPVGDYEVLLYMDNVLKNTVPFKVE